MAGQAELPPCLARLDYANKAPSCLPHPETE
jgi:hypothetical protein